MKATRKPNKPQNIDRKLVAGMEPYSYKQATEEVERTRQYTRISSKEQNEGVIFLTVLTTE